MRAVSTEIQFYDGNELVLTMQQTEGAPVAGDHVKQYVFTLFNGSGRRLGNLAPELTHGYGYNRAIAIVSSALLREFPYLTLTVTTYHGNGNDTHFKWVTDDIRRRIAQERLDRAYPVQ